MLHVHAPFMPVSGCLVHRFMPIIFFRDTNKCCNKDITKYLPKYQIKRSSTSTKTSASTSTKYDTYNVVHPSLSTVQVQPPRRLHSAVRLPQLARSLHAAPAQLRPRRRRAHAASTPLTRCPHAAALSRNAASTPPLCCLHAAALSRNVATTPPPRRLHAASTSP